MSEEPANPQICPCEQVAHGDLGPVGGDERLARIALHPKHFKKTGELKLSIIPTTHLMTSGFSLTRVEHVDRVEMNAIAEDIVRASGEPEHKGVALLIAKEIRELNDVDGVQAFCVIDDPIIGQAGYRDNPAHAIVKRSAEQDEPEIKRLREELFKRFLGPVSIDELFLEAGEESSSMDLNTPSDRKESG